MRMEVFSFPKTIKRRLLWLEFAVFIGPPKNLIGLNTSWFEGVTEIPVPVDITLDEKLMLHIGSCCLLANAISLDFLCWFGSCLLLLSRGIGFKFGLSLDNGVLRSTIASDTVESRRWSLTFRDDGLLEVCTLQGLGFIFSIFIYIFLKLNEL